LRVEELPARGEAPTALPMIDTDEVAQLSAAYGAPLLRVYNVLADDYIRAYRWKKDSDRRAEVVFAVQDEPGRLWVHAKPHYPAHIFRLPSGGVHLHERVEDALLREVEEEMNLPVEIARFLGIVEYRFWHGPCMVPFASYVFHLTTGNYTPACRVGEEISAFRAVLPSQIAQIAVDLRNLIGDRRGWGQWRALAHDLVYDTVGAV
jgi:8-oxo-dGTP pyrophosphatase MutT (NUDIX family)